MLSICLEIFKFFCPSKIYYLATVDTTKQRHINPVTLKIWLLILPTSHYTFASKLVMGI